MPTGAKGFREGSGAESGSLRMFNSSLAANSSTSYKSVLSLSQYPISVIASMIFKKEHQGIHQTKLAKTFKDKIYFFMRRRKSLQSNGFMLILSFRMTQNELNDYSSSSNSKINKFLR